MTSSIVETIDIAADPKVVWAAVSDPRLYGRWSPEATGAKRRSGSGPWAVGDRFVGTNRAKVRWSTRCRVVAADPEREFAFEVSVGLAPLARWSYELAPIPGGTRVIERWIDRRDGIRGVLVRPAGLFVGRGYDAATRNRATMVATLATLKRDLEG